MGGSRIRFGALAALVAAALSAWAVEAPFQNSKLGYVRVDADGVSLSPRHPRVFIQPRGRLPVVQNTPDALLLAAATNGATALCSVPKTPANMALVKLTARRDLAVFSGPLEAEAVPFPLLKGEELPILERRPDGFLAKIQRSGHVLPLWVPAGLKGVSFAARSEFDAFAERQRQRGLVELDGRWLPAAKAKAVTDARRSRADARKRHAQHALSQAKSGTLVLNNREALDGSLKGFDGDKLLFITADGSRWVPVGDVVDSPREEAVALGHLFKAEKRLAAARALTLDRQIGESLAQVEAATAELDAADPVQAEASRRQANEWTMQLRARLAAGRLAICGDEVLPADEVAWHEARGHLRFQRRYWLEEGQICGRCHGSGELKCPGCAGLGKTSHPCEACAGKGKLVCPRCEGTGWRVCRQCNGTGVYPKRCARCQGSGQVQSRTPSYFGDAPSTTMMGNGMVVGFGGFSPVWKTYQWVTCPVCDGQGTVAATCPGCNGQGKLPCPKKVDCAACAGKGAMWEVCAQCGGEKMIKCGNCEGRGFTGAPQAIPPK